MGDRLSQTVGITTTRYVLDPAAGLTQVLADGTNTYLYGNGRLAQYQTAMQYYGADGLGSVRQLYDAGGQVVATNRYDPFGSLMSQSGTATSVFGFTGEQLDATGLTYLRARYYANAQGRFLTRDVWEGDPNAPMSYNAWLYVSGNPINSTDPSGQCTGIAPWTDFVGGALSSTGGGLSGLGGYLQAGAAASQKMAANCTQNLAMAKTRFEEGNYGASFAYASGLNTALNESAAWLADHDANAGLGWWANWFGYQDRLANSRFVRMYYREPQTWWLRLRPEDLPDLLEDADAACQIGGTGLTIASFITPGVFAVKGSLGGSLQGVGRFGVADEFMPAWFMEQETAWANLSQSTAAATKALAIRPQTALTIWQKYPPNEGFLGGYSTTVQATAGKVLSGIGELGGKYVSPPGTTLSQRGLLSNYPNPVETLLEVAKPFNMKAGAAQPWMGTEGLGIQYKLPDTVENLLLNETLKRLN